MNIIQRLAASLGMICFAQASQGAPDDALYSALLRDRVSNAGLVDYAALKTDTRLRRYLASIAATDPADLTEPDARLAFWLNAYNAYTLKLVADHFPIRSIHDLATGGRIIGFVIRRTPWDIAMAEVNGKLLTLNQIEHEMIRARFSEPRIHFALVCAALSCPPLRREAYEAGRLAEQLDDQGRRFLGDPTRNRFDPSARRAELSRVFSWFAGDFGGTREAVFSYVARYAPKDAQPSLHAEPATWRLGYTPYDWGLNAQ